jgi:hypothetical protein
MLISHLKNFLTSFSKVYFKGYSFNFNKGLIDETLPCKLYFKNEPKKGKEEIKGAMTKV